MNPVMARDVVMVAEPVRSAGLLRRIASAVSGVHLPETLAAPTHDEIMQLRHLESIRTATGIEHAKVLGHDGAMAMWLRHASELRHAEPGRVRGWAATGSMIAAVGTALLASTIAKAAYTRPRPFVEDGISLALAGAPVGSSFPSSHAAVSRAAAESLASFASASHGAEMLSDAARVAVSRVYTGAHFPSDVRAGAEIGSSVARRISGAVQRLLGRIGR